MKAAFSKKKLEWAATSRHEFDFEAFLPVLPPFYSTTLFLPKIYLKIKNNGKRINKATINVDVRKYDGDISSVTTINDNWGDTGQNKKFNVNNWNPGVKKSFTAIIPGRRLSSAGTYIVRVRITKLIHLGTPYEELIKEL